MGKSKKNTKSWETDISKQKKHWPKQVGNANDVTSNARYREFIKSTEGVRSK